MEDLKGIIEKLPLTLILGLFIAALGFEYYTFTTDPTSPLGLKKSQYEASKVEVSSLKIKLKTAKDFFQTLEAKVTEIRGLQSQLESMRTALSSEISVPAFVKMVVTEASRVGLRVLSIKPTELKTTELYAEQSFEMKYKGVFSQLLVFMDRIAKLERIIRIDNFDIVRKGSASANYVEIDGSLQLKAYRYIDAPKTEPAKNPGQTPSAQGVSAGVSGGGA